MDELQDINLLSKVIWDGGLPTIDNFNPELENQTAGENIRLQVTAAKAVMIVTPAVALLIIPGCLLFPMHCSMLSQCARVTKLHRTNRAPERFFSGVNAPMHGQCRTTPKPTIAYPAQMGPFSTVPGTFVNA
uniref:Uncharacterized protein n=1 Tax=Anopheles culicifacies TaxID=139723 RepID=A0A182M6A4_9DIPT